MTLNVIAHRTVAPSIAALDLVPVSVVLRDPAEGQGWSDEQCAVAELWYRRFLTLALTEPVQDLVPAIPVDTFWHTHILNTRKYAADCTSVFGGFLHHDPHFGRRSCAEDARKRALHHITVERLEGFGESHQSLYDAFPGAAGRGGADCHPEP